MLGHMRGLVLSSPAPRRQETCSYAYCALGLAAASLAQETPERPGDSGVSEQVFYHGKQECDYTDRLCVWGRPFDATGPNRARPNNGIDLVAEAH